MRTLISALCFMLTTTAFLSCKPYCKCEPNTVQDFTVKVINSQGQNMVTGPQSLYKVDSIKLLKKRNDFSSQTGNVSKWYSDTTFLSFYLYGPEAKTFIYYNQQTPADSLEINWTSRKGRCCGDPYTYYSLQEVKFNGTIVQPQTASTLS